MYRNREKSQLNVHLYIGYFPWKKRRQNFLLISSKEPRLKPSLAPAIASREGNWKKCTHSNIYSDSWCLSDRG